MGVAYAGHGLKGGVVRKIEGMSVLITGGGSGLGEGTARRLASLGDKVTALTVSLDLPFAMTRFCGAEDIKSMRNGSDYMDRSFGTHWGVLIDELKILARAVFVLDSKGVVQYAQVVTEVASEPDYDAALAALQKLVG
jgi:thiol peroxidase